MQRRRLRRRAHTHRDESAEHLVARHADANYVYFSLTGSTTTATGEIRACALPDCNGGVPVSVAKTQAQPVSIALDGQGFVYWANAGLYGQGEHDVGHPARQVLTPPGAVQPRETRGAKPSTFSYTLPSVTAPPSAGIRCARRPRRAL